MNISCKLKKSTFAKNFIPLLFNNLPATIVFSRIYMRRTRICVRRSLKSIRVQRVEYQLGFSRRLLRIKSGRTNHEINGVLVVVLLSWVWWVYDVIRFFAIPYTTCHVIKLFCLAVAFHYLPSQISILDGTTRDIITNRFGLVDHPQR